jgi:hypothetical protein
MLTPILTLYVLEQIKEAERQAKQSAVLGPLQRAKQAIETGKIPREEEAAQVS